MSKPTQQEICIDISATIEKLRYEVMDIDNGKVRSALQDQITAMKQILRGNYESNER